MPTVSAGEERVVAGDGLVMVCLSTFRQSEAAVVRALQEAGSSRRLCVVFVADQNLARYLIGTDAGVSEDLRERCEEEVLFEHLARGREVAEAVVSRAQAEGISATEHVVVGRFAVECLKVIADEKPSVVVTTRSQRPAWVRRFFGSPVDHLIAAAGCPVIEV